MINFVLNIIEMEIVLGAWMKEKDMGTSWYKDFVIRKQNFVLHQILTMHLDAKNARLGITRIQMTEDVTLILKDVNIIKVDLSVNSVQMLTYFTIGSAYQLQPNA